jgi:hypothetical protein
MTDKELKTLNAIINITVNILQEDLRLCDETRRNLKNIEAYANNSKQEYLARGGDHRVRTKT